MWEGMKHFHRLRRAIAFLFITSILLISFPISLFKLRDVVIESENTLNVQYFCFKCEKLNGYKAEER